ncbi:flagellar basal-body MS-ring/collar protein FliF [Aminiphilus sp.]|uniref:flagellar basal-body MS-ring/collar protein FliF n=1 Tax=Aminiphilus sp. TaxID=1872488 RepID=UPI002638104E|nr:flagellar basal-body MS-ring/collar protein FliF [Aminiphilus sp.]
MERIRQFFSRIRVFWESLVPWQRYSLLGASVLVVAAIVLLVLWSGRTAYDPLFSGLEVDDQASIVATLREQKIPYRLDPVANAILVPRDVVHEARLNLASAGLPKGGVVGFEIFDRAKMGMSDFQQRITYLRGLEGELARTVLQIDAVEYAKVNIVIPEQRLFLEQQQPSTASVLVRLKQGRKVGPEQVRSIVHLVAHSVEGLRADDVTVVDTAGNVLSDMIADENFIFAGSDGLGSSVSSVQRELERQQEQEFERKLRVMLERVFGPGKAVVRVRVELDFDKRKVSTREFIPGPTGKGVIRSQQDMEETYEGPGSVPGAPPGTTTNIPGYAITGQQQGNSEYAKTESTKNYEITTREEEQVGTPGTVKRVSASVLVDGTLSDEQLGGLKEAVAAAIGIDEVRGDKLVIQPMPFSTSFVDNLLAQLQEQRRQQLLMGMIALALVLVGAVGVALWWMRRRRRLLLEQAAGGEEGKVPSLRELMENPDLMAGQSEVVVLEEQLRIYAMKNPEDVAAVIKNWLAEE